MSVHRRRHRGLAQRALIGGPLSSACSTSFGSSPAWVPSLDDSWIGSHVTSAAPDRVSPPARDWEVLRNYANADIHRYWQLANEVLHAQLARIDREIRAGVARTREPGTLWAPLVDLALGSESSEAYPYPVPLRHRQALELADPSHATEAVLAAGTPLRFMDGVYDSSYEGLGSNFWEVAPASAAGTPYLATALEFRWGGEAALVDALIVPIGEPILGDQPRIARLVDDLYAIVERVRLHALAQ
jgi:hypothetical protein